MQNRKKSIFCMQYVCKVHCKYVVAHAYNIVAKIQSSSGWAFLGCAALSAACTEFGNVLASGCCAGNFSGMATCPSKWSTLRWGLKECGSSFPFSFNLYAILLTSCQKCVQSQSGIMYLIFNFIPYVWINQTLWTTLGLASNSRVDWGMSITLFLFTPLNIFSQSTVC